jgi:hypothetical protein
MSSGNRRTLARTLERCLRPASRHHDIFAAARGHVRRDPQLRRELEAVIERLQCHDAHAVGVAVGVALIHQLVTNAGSPLYSGTAGELRENLGRIGFHLETGQRLDRDH